MSGPIGPRAEVVACSDYSIFQLSWKVRRLSLIQLAFHYQICMKLSKVSTEFVEWSISSVSSPTWNT